MKKLILRALAMPVASMMAPFSVAESQIDEVVITASPHGKTRDEIAGSLNILSGEELNRQVANTLGQTLQNQLGINNSTFGPAVGLPVIRGLSGSRVEVLQNSTPLNDASATSPDHAIAIEPVLADRIEILRGPATLRFGPGAIGGVLNIIDNRIHTEAFSGLKGVAETRYDTNGNGKVAVGRLDAGNGPLNLHLSGVRRTNDEMEIPGTAARQVPDPDDTSHGTVPNTNGDANSWSAGLSHVRDTVAVGFGVSRVENHYGIPPGGHTHDHSEEDSADEGEHDEAGDLFTRIQMRQTEYSGKLKIRELPGEFNNFILDLSHSDYRHIELEIEGGRAAPGTRYETQSDNIRAELTHGESGSWLGALGIQYSDTEFDARGEEAFVPPNQVRTTGIFLNEDTDMGGGTLSLGLRYDRQDARPEGNAEVSHNLTNAAVSYLFPLTAFQQIGVILSHSQRPPSAEELFALGEHVAINSYQVGDAGLSKESANSLEITWSLAAPVTINASLYHRQFSDFIFEANAGEKLSHDLVEGGGQGAAACSADLDHFEVDTEEYAESLPCFFYRQQDARFTGAEAEIIAPLGDAVELRVWGDMVRARLDHDGNVPRIPPARLGAGVTFDHGIWKMGINITHALEQDRAGNNEPATDAYTRLDSNLSANIENWTLFFQANNLTDEEIRNSTSFLRDISPEPGRSLVFGVRYRLN
jgi:iron complex outermembrane recepter protein